MNINIGIREIAKKYENTNDASNLFVTLLCDLDSTLFDPVKFRCCCCCCSWMTYRQVISIPVTDSSISVRDCLSRNIVIGKPNRLLDCIVAIIRHLQTMSGDPILLEIQLIHIADDGTASNKAELRYLNTFELR